MMYSGLIIVLLALLLVAFCGLSVVVFQLVRSTRRDGQALDGAPTAGTASNNTTDPVSAEGQTEPTDDDDHDVSAADDDHQSPQLAQRSAHLAQRSAQLDQRSTELDERERRLSEAVKRLEQRIQQADEHDAQTSRSDADVAQREAQLEQRRRELDDHAQDLSRREDALKTANSQLEDTTRQLSERARQVDAQQQKLEAATQSFAMRDEAITAREAEIAQIRSEVASSRTEMSQLSQRLDARSTALDDRENRLGAERDKIRALEEKLEARRDKLDAESEQLNHELENVRAELERVGGLSAEQAKAELMKTVEHDTRRAAAARARQIEEDAQRNAEKIAREIVMTTVQRVATEQTSDAVVTTVDLPNDEMKGRIIGREGRNIRSFEQITGVNVMVDDTPGSVLLSSFDPVRREVARVTMAELVADGRIHPARIEEVYARSIDEVMRSCQDAAEHACMELGLDDIDPGLYQTIGALKYRTSYGQNVLDHMLECGRIAGAIAAEIGLDVASCKRAAFLHDIGKAVVTHGDGSHALEGAEIARKYGEAPEIVNAIASHHGEVEVTSAEAVIAQSADAISGSRPGARRESLEAYVHRLEKLEEIAGSHDGVDKVFAMQAGREVRVMVVPEEVDEATSYQLAKDIAQQVEEELTYPGNIRITVVRESRATQLAH